MKHASLPGCGHGHGGQIDIVGRTGIWIEARPRVGATNPWEQSSRTAGSGPQISQCMP